MKSLKSIARKSAKARARRKDYVYRKNVNSNVPTIKKTNKFEKYKSITKVDPVTKLSSIELKHVGYKNKTVKIPTYRNYDNVPTSYKRDEHRRNVGMIEYPLRKKTLLSREVRLKTKNKRYAR